MFNAINPINPINENSKLEEILAGIQKIIEILSELESSPLSSSSFSSLSSYLSSGDDMYTYGKGYAEVIDENSYYTPYSSIVNLHSSEHISETAWAKYMKKMLSERNYGE